MNNAKKIFCIQGMSGVGKDTLVNLVSKKLNIPTLVSHTTRPIREGEVRDKTYYFVNEVFFEHQHDNFLELREYKVWNGDTWFYGVQKVELENRPYSLFIVDRQGYEDLEEKIGDKLISIMITVDKEELLKRLNLRGDNQSEISRRLEDDIKRFEGFKPDYTVVNNDLMKAAKQLEEIIKKEMGQVLDEEKSE